MTTASGNDDPFDRGLTNQARLSLAGIHAVFKLEEALITLSIDVIGDGGPTEGDGFLENFLHREIQTPEIFAFERRRPTAWPYTRAKQRLIGIDVSYPAEQPLVQECALDGSLASFEKLYEAIEFYLQRLGTGGLELMRHAETSETPRIDKA